MGRLGAIFIMAEYEDEDGGG